VEPGWAHRIVLVGDRRVFVRTSLPDLVSGTTTTPILHVHGFAISGAYLMPTARRLTSRGVNLVPDLPGYGRSQRPHRPLAIPDLADAAARFLDELGIERVVLVGNSMGCAISAEMAVRHPDRVEQVVLVAPAGGVHNQPFSRAVRQLAVDGVREQPRMARVAVPDYVRFGPLNALRLFGELTRFPSLERLLEMSVPALAVLGSRDPLMPDQKRVFDVGRLAADHITIVMIEGAAHAVNYSHSGELAHVIGSWLDGREIVDDPDQPGLTRVLQVPRS
jgi:pimeloyl-ACP methyl ester carboxylesterase